MVDSGPVTPAQPSVVTLPAEVDAVNADAIGEQIAAALTPGGVVIADMTASTVCDSIGTRMLVLTWQRAIALGTRTAAAAANPAVLRIIKLQGLDAVLPIYHGLEEALAGNSPAPSAD